MPRVQSALARRKNEVPVVIAKPAKLDIAMQRVANGSQIALVILAVFGYFYTVLPVYQKSLLDEEIQLLVVLGQKIVDRDA